MKNIKIKTIDGIELNCSYFNPETPSNQVVLISPATGVKKHVYNHFAEFLIQHGFTVMTWDWRGISDNLTGPIQDNLSIMEDWAKKDLNAMINWASEHLPEYDLFAIGHSFGGQAFGLAPDIEKVQALVTVATQSGYWKLWPAKQRYQFAALWYGLMPVCTHLLGYFPSKKLGLGENLPKGVALQWAAWARKPDYMGDYLGHEKMTQPILAYNFTDDGFAPKAAVLAFHQHYNHCAITYKEVSPKDIGVKTIGHFGFFKHPESKQLWLEVVDFLHTTPKHKLGT